MTTTMHTIEVPLPEGALATPEDIEVLGGLLRAIAATRFDTGQNWPGVKRSLERGGWEVKWGLQWHVEVRRGRDLEQACGRTLDEAFATVAQFTAAEEPLEGPP
jgi:hypothetical protein